MGDEKDLFVRVIMSSKQEFDEDFEEIVEVSCMEVMCVINRSRIVLNLPLVKDLIGLQVAYTNFLNAGLANFNEIVHHDKHKMHHAVSLFLKKSKLNQWEKLVVKILVNFAKSNLKGKELDKFML